MLGQRKKRNLCGMVLKSLITLHVLLFQFSGTRNTKAASSDYFLIIRHHLCPCAQLLSNKTTLVCRVFIFTFPLSDLIQTLKTLRNRNVNTMIQNRRVKCSDVLGRKPANFLHSWHLSLVSLVSVSDREITDIKQKQQKMTELMTRSEN